MGGFMQGYSFIDNIQSRKRNEQRLEERLEQDRLEREYQRGRERTRDAQVLQDRGISAEIRAENQRRYDAEDLVREQERNRVATLRERTGKANEIIAEVHANNADPRMLDEYDDLDVVKEYKMARFTQEQKRADIQGYLENYEGEEPPAEEGLSQQFEADPLPEARLEQEPFPIEEQGPALTPDELNKLADEDPAGAMALRDKQLAAANDPRTPAEKSRELNDKTKSWYDRNELLRAKRDDLNNTWAAAFDINDPSGEPMRRLAPEQQVGAYYDARADLDPELQARGDKRMAPHVRRTIQSQTEIFAKTQPGTTEHRNAKRRLTEGYTLANAMSIEYSPVRLAGVDDRGLPPNNEVLVDSVIDQARQGPVGATGREPNAVRADITMMNRPNKGKRLSQRKADGAYRLMMDQTISFADFEYYMRNNGQHRPFVGKISPRNPRMDYYQENQDGSQTLIQAARDPDKDSQDGRNKLTAEGRRQVERNFSVLNTDEYPDRGLHTENSFYRMLAHTEQRAINAGYDYGNPLDMASLSKRFLDFNVIIPAYNSEVRTDDEWFPSFSNNYNASGPYDYMFNRDTENIDIDEISPGIQMFGADALPLEPLKARPDWFYDNVRRSEPGLENASDAQIEEMARAEGL